MGKQKKLIDVHFPVNFKGRYRGLYMPPKGTFPKDVKFEEVKEAGCIQAISEKQFQALLKSTNNNPCRGCPEWDANGHKCSAFQKFHSAWTKYVEEEKTKEADHKTAITPHNLPPYHKYAKKNIKELSVILETSIKKTRELRRHNELEAALVGR